MPLKRKLLLASLACVVLVALLEVAARVVLEVWDPQDVPLQVGWQHEAGSERQRDLLYLPDDDTFFRLRPGARLVDAASATLFDVQINSQGFRGPELAVAKEPGSLRVLAAGDSCTFGSGAATGLSFPAQLQALLEPAHPERRIEVVNAGVPGYTSFQGRRFLETRGVALQPDVVILTFGFNDALAASPGAKRIFDRRRPLTDREYARLLQRGAPLALERLAEVLARRLASWRGIRQPHPGEDPAAAAAALPVKTRVPLEEYQENLAAMIELCRRHGARPLIVLWPAAIQVRESSEHAPSLRPYQVAAAELAVRHGVPVVDLLPPLRSRPEWYIDAAHLNREGYAAVAGVLASHVEALLGPAQSP